MDNNTWSLIGAASVTGLFTYIVTRWPKRFDVRLQNEAALLGMPLPIIAEQNKRIASLQAEIDRLWRELQAAQEREQECRDTLSEYRHENRTLLQKITILEQRLTKLENKDV